MKLIKFLWRRN